MASKKSPQQWQAIFDTYKTSGLTVAKFCQQNTIAPSVFYANQQRLKQTLSFIKAQVVAKPILKPSSTDAIGIRFSCSAGEVYLPSHIPAHYLVKLIRGLSA